MISGSVVFYKIATTCLIILVGYIASRMQLIPEKSSQVISRYVLIIALPTYMIYYMPSSISPSTLHLYWFYPLLGFLLVAVSDLAAYLAAKLLARPGDRATFRILAGIPNWVFMALAVCEPLFGQEGVRVVLLYNIGITIYVWTLGMTSFRGGEGIWSMLKNVFLNLQSVAIAVGLLLALTCPFLRGMEKMSAEQLAELPWYVGIVSPAWECMYLLGMTALPVSILQIGIMLGARSAEAAALRKGGTSVPAGQAAWTAETSELFRIGFFRLLAIPAVIMIVLALALGWGLPLSMNEYVISVIVLAMPPAVACMAVTEVYGGNTGLAAKGILWMTVAALATAPVATWAATVAYGLFFG